MVWRACFVFSMSMKPVNAEVGCESLGLFSTKVVPPYGASYAIGVTALWRIIRHRGVDVLCVTRRLMCEWNCTGAGR
eukprot:5905918-Prymnesium_polylepis.1